MIQIFKNRQLTRTAGQKSLQWFIVPERGGKRETVLWVGNDAFGRLTAELKPGDTSIKLTNAGNFPAFGSVRIGDQYIRYTANDGVTLSGVPVSGLGSVAKNVPATSAVRSANREHTEENLWIKADAFSGGRLRMRSLVRRWNRKGASLEKLPSSYTIHGSSLVTSVQELWGDQDLLLHYDFTSSGPVQVRDLSQNRYDAVAQRGEIAIVPAFPFASVSASFAGGAELFIDRLGSVFPSAGTMELWVRGVTGLCGLFSVCDPITGGEKFAVKLNADKTVRVTQELSSGLIRTYNGFVPADVRDGWNQVAVSWTASSVSIYVNGALDSSFELAEPIAAAGDCYLARSANEKFNGGMFKVRLWKSVLGSDRIAAMWNGGDSWMPNENEPILGVEVEVTSDAGERISQGFALRTQEIQSYDQDPRAAVAWCQFVRRDNGLRHQMRVLPVNRRIPDSLPAFRWGEYRWRQDEQSSKEVVPARWDSDLSVFGDRAFQSGIGQGDDLEFVTLEKITELNSIRPVLRGGEYFIGQERNYLPADPALEIIDPSTKGPFTIAEKPKPTKPIFVGRWRSNQVDRYVKDVVYRYVGDRFSKDQEFDVDDPGFQCRLDRKERKLYLSQSLPAETSFIGIYPSTEVVFTFRLPVHPVLSVQRIYLANGRSPKYWSFDQQRGTVTIEIDQAELADWAQQLIYADYLPALAVLYEKNSAVETFRGDVELNPVYAGVSDGFLYLQHKIWQPKSLELQVDKPRIPYVPANLPDDVQFGPVMPDDFAVLTVTAFGNNADELITGSRLRVLVDNQKFTGAVNYQNPAKQEVWVTTGADGSASLVYTPGNTFGYYIALSSIAAKTITLPEEVPVEQLYDDNVEEFIVHTYAVRTDDPYLGKVDADTDAGEVAWTEYGVAGTASYKTNGRRREWKTPAGDPVFPSDLQDANGKSFRDPAFSGQVKYIIFTDDLLTGAGIGAYFVAFAGKATIRLYSPFFNVVSNPITLRVVPPEQITEISLVDDSIWDPIAGYLTLNDFAELSGRMNVNRLTGGPLLVLRFSRRV